MGCATTRLARSKQCLWRWSGTGRWRGDSGIPGPKEAAEDDRRAAAAVEKIRIMLGELPVITLRLLTVFHLCEATANQNIFSKEILIWRKENRSGNIH
jgi:hypothetical protein